MSTTTIINIIKGIADIIIIWILFYYLLKSMRNNVKLTLILKGVVIILLLRLASDIFNLRPNPQPKTRINPSHTSNIFSGAKNDNQFSKDIKKYTEQRRIPEKEYDPTPYYSKLNAREQKAKFVFSDHQFI